MCGVPGRLTLSNELSHRAAAVSGLCRPRKKEDDAAKAEEERLGSVSATCQIYPVGAQFGSSGSGNIPVPGVLSLSCSPGLAWGPGGGSCAFPGPCPRLEFGLWEVA